MPFQLPFPLPQDTLLTALLAAYFALQVFDGWTTWQVLKHGGVEKNPLVRALIDALGKTPGLVVAKVIGALLGLYMAYFGQVEALAVLTAVYFGVVVWNLKVLKRVRADK